MDVPSCTKVQLKSIKAAKKKLVIFLEATSDPSFTAGGFVAFLKRAGSELAFRC